MADWYVNPAAIGANNGTSTTDAWTDVQSAFDNVSTAGDNVYCKGTQTLTAIIDIDTNSGAASNLINFIGVNDSWVDDGTPFVLDGDSTTSNCIRIQTVTISYLYIKNFKVINATTNGVLHSSELRDSIFDNFESSNNGTNGVNCSQKDDRTVYINSKYHNNSSSGIAASNIGAFHNCSFINNGAWGTTSTTAVHMAYCLGHNNTSGNVRFDSLNNSAINCVLDGSAIGIQFSNTASFLVNCRITNNTTGINLTGSAALVDNNNSFFNNTADRAGTEFKTTNEVTLTSDGYTNKGADDFSLSSDGEGIGVELPIGGNGATTNANITSGFPPEYPTDDAPTFAGITAFEIITPNKFAVSWSAGTGTITEYAIYLRDGSSSVFNIAYLVKKVDDGITSTVVSLEADNSTYLKAGSTYHCGVRACNNSVEDSNTATISNECVGSEQNIKLPIQAVVM